MLLFPYGGEFKWIHLSLREYPGIRYVLIFVNEGILKEWEDDTNAKTYLEKVQEEINVFKNQEQERNIPPRFEVKMKALCVPDFIQFADFFGFFRTVFQNIQPFLNSFSPDSVIQKKKSLFNELFMDNVFSQIHIHLNSGLMMYRLGLFQCANEFRFPELHIFIFNKDSSIPEVIPLHHELKTIENRVLQILQHVDQISVSDLQNRYKEEYEQKSLSYILKVVNRLIEMNYVQSIKDGREKQISLTSFSLSAFKSEKFHELLRKTLNSM